MGSNPYKISFLLPTYNCESIIRKTLESILWADEIVIVDSYSSDSTLDILKEYDVKIIQNKYINSAKQKNWAIQFCSYDWIFQIDSDEILEKNAENIIRGAIENASEKVECFKMPRKNYVLGKWMQYGGIYPDWEYRLFRNGKGNWKDREVHSRIIVEGEIRLLDTSIIHNGMPSLTKQLKNLDRYTRYEADELNKKYEKYSLIKWILGPIYIFIKRYIYQRGYKDGWRGFYVAVYHAIYLFISYAKFIEMKKMQLIESPK
tara:strand:- start:1208 stop:1990 length:783 start_codon:yes stop_codon:yes gene_type:complete